MNRDRLGQTFSVGGFLAIGVGTGLILFGGGTGGNVGSVVLILGLISIMPALRFSVLEDAGS